MTTATFPKGLEGVVAAETEMSYIDGQAGILEYVGIPIGELSSNSTFEETVFLLWNKRLPNQAELDAISSKINSLAEIPQGIVDAIKATPKTAEPMHVLRTMVSMLAMYDPSPNENDLDAAREKSVRILAQAPTIVAYFDRHRRGLDFVAPKQGVSFAYNFLWMLNGAEPTDAMISAFDKCMILHADHGLNNSTFTARVVISTLSDVYSAMSAAIGSLRGPLHGGANEGVMKMLNLIPTVDDAESFIMERIANKDKIMGFGHRVYKTKDPRAKDLQGLAKQLAEDTGNQDLYAKSSTIERVMERELGAKGIYPNVDFYSATTYHCIGLKLDLFTPMFALSRIAGWAGHVLEQLDGNRLYRPTTQYVGPHDAPYIPMSQR
ncbi:MAG: citrate synthase [Phycisphaeraceae bacterium]|nr:citrate synthase [Phycisphaerales bacterium]MCB9860722.1 citrate synthase [Phycisphaeraceae bacterium]